ncbi:MAG: DUF6103 family protein [Oscillospiraceae bacterium]|nr:DUF6103 family protein [Oscillospiraceae bacterium]MDD4510654.1 DUF6103 family protein [Oscillospiraceae bacterium]
MKKTTLSIAVEQEKLNAIRFYVEKKDANIEDELEDFLGKLYEKYVPAATREYIESMAAMAEAQPKSAAKRVDRQKEKSSNEVRDE